MEFGIYPGNGLLQGAPDNPAAIQAALDELQGDAPTFLVRAYLHYKGERKTANHTPLQPQQYAVRGRKLDLVLCYQTHDTNMDNWRAFIEHTVDEYGEYLGALQITEETNVAGHGMDGDYPAAKQALITGIIAAKNALRSRGLHAAVGFNATPMFAPDTYWHELGAQATPDFLAALDYVGLDFFPDVFRPIPADQLEQTIEFVIQSLRKRDLPAAHIETGVPIRITENGWPTGVGRSPEKQADILARIVRTLYAIKDTYNLTHYEFFQLRDGNTGNSDTLHHFGMMDDAYAPKPAFEIYKKLIAELHAR